MSIAAAAHAASPALGTVEAVESTSRPSVPAGARPTTGVASVRAAFRVVLVSTPTELGRTFRRDIADLFKARFPIVYIQTHEEERVVADIMSVAEDIDLIRTPRKVYHWSLTAGLIDAGGGARSGTQDPLKALEAVEQVDEPGLFILKDFHVFFGGRGIAPVPEVIRKLRDVVPLLKQSARPRNLVITAPTMVLPPELEKEVTVVEFALPTGAEIRERLREMIEINRESGRIVIDVDEEDEERLVQAALGLTLQEAENSFARAMVHDGRLDVNDVELVLEEKRQIIQKTGVLEFIRSSTTFDDVGGLENLKRWLTKRDGAWLEEAARYCLPSPKGVLITGVPGCGKSLTAKCVSTQWGLPLLRLDIGRIFSGVVGSSEENMRAALRSAEAIAPSVLWIDEIEKGFSSAGGGGDSGVSARVFGTFLTWMQEKEKAVFVIATSNSIDALPAEFLRKGRFDEIFFVDLPTRSEREQILAVHLEARLRDPEVSSELDDRPGVIRELAQRSEGYSGAELEQVVISGLFEAYSQRRPLRAEDLEKGLTTMVPLSVTQAEQIARTREWANVRAVAATAAEDRGDRPEAEDATPLPPPAEARGGRALDF